MNHHIHFACFIIMFYAIFYIQLHSPSIHSVKQLVTQMDIMLLDSFNQADYLKVFRHHTDTEVPNILIIILMIIINSKPCIYL